MAAAGSAAELDFFRMEKESSSPKPHPKKLFDRRRNFRDIQSVISKMNPELLKSVIASGSVDQSSNSSKPSEKSLTPKHNGCLFPVLPVYTTPFWSNTCGGSESTPETSPLTIFYNGTVAVFDVPRHKAHNILKMAEGGGVFKTVESQEPKLAMLCSGDQHQHQLLETLDGDLPMERRKSLHRFLEKRKERLTLVSPYGCLTDHAHSRKNTPPHGD